MDRSRRREFQDIRQSRRQPTDTTSIVSTVIQPIQRPTGQACNNCINKILAEEKKRKQVREKRKVEREQKKRLKQLMKLTDPKAIQRQRLLKDTGQYNGQIINQHIIQKNQQKEYQKQCMKSLEFTDTQLQKQMKQQFQKDKNRNKKYRQQLQQQMRLNQEKRQIEKQKDKQIIIVPYMETSKSYDQNQLKNFLKTQIEEKQRIKQQLKEQKLRQEKDMLNSYNNQSIDSAKKIYNPQVFIELSKIDQAKKINGARLRQEKQKQRKKQLIQDSQARRQYIYAKMKDMESYVQDLSQQINQRKVKEAEEKQKAIKEKQFNPYQEDQFTKSRQYKNCIECNKKYPAEYISPIPPI